MNSGDVYQRLITLANASHGDVGDLTVDLVRQLRALGEHGKTLVEFLDEGQTEYLALLGARGRHHVNLAMTYVTNLGAAAVAPTDTELAQQGLRDFYHHAYYAAFFLGRYRLVTLGHYDCNEHKLICEVLAKKEKELRDLFKTTRDSGHEEIAEGLEVLRKLIAGPDPKNGHKNQECLLYRRNIADYVMNMTRLAILSNVDELKYFAETLSHLYRNWSVP